MLFVWTPSQGLSQDRDRDGLTDEQELSSSNPDQVDTDGDFLTDREEFEFSTDPNRVDTDGDGLSDFAEIRIHGTFPRVADSDRGGIVDGREVLVDLTDPRDALDDALDSDGDGLLDGAEGALGTNPFRRDSDGDWIDDSDEDANLDGVWAGDIDQDGRFTASSGDETNPAVADTDGDGLHDGWEKFTEQTHSTQTVMTTDFLTAKNTNNGSQMTFRPDALIPLSPTQIMTACPIWRK